MLGQELRHVLCEERPDPADVVEGKSGDRVTAVMLEAQDSPSWRIMPRFLNDDEGDTTTSSTVTDRSRAVFGKVLARKTHS